MATEIPIEQLLEAILDAQNQGNALMGEILERMIRAETDRLKALDHAHEKQQQQTAQELALDRWKANNQQLSRRCKLSLEKFSELQKNYLTRMLDDIDNMDPEGEFEMREFIDKYGQGFLQLNGIIQAVSHLGS